MKIITRRAVLAAAGTLAAGTVAAVTLWRKPAAPPIATPIVPAAGEPLVRLQAMSALIPTDPPRPPAEAAFLDADGNPHGIADFAGKGLVINLWATWCVPCVAEMPALQDMARKLAGENIVVLPLSSDRGGAPVVRKFYAAHGIDALPVWLDPKGEAGRAWNARGLPTTLIIDRQGRERGRLEGAVDWASEASLAEIRRLVG
ncbi:TlpA disulfide reductase family protein [Limobrevibacterium gyesilva]|uniref:TlpA family protein disulfide reductase n=1 Tax=Limobrevibacterium gyesilva TaxID=2991712 RepID=A0AA42CJJ7_9PROT|nr:TlpA disulfide reductase family protein [Limobrevibacterium gyesilva]MCW3476972.1 TlpA family protein disulfide reductase [Limobrevibacterium gyesilva]